MKLYLIRHGATAGNLEHRYVGRTDEALLPESVEKLTKEKKPFFQNRIFLGNASLYVSPMKRCLQTAQILFPSLEAQVIRELRECDFGAFEYCNFSQLSGDPDYQRYIDSNGITAFPGGEDLRSFQERCVKGFEQILKERKERSLREGKPAYQEAALILVVHGGTIMALLDRYSEPHKDYFEWQIRNGEGYEAEVILEPDGETVKYLRDIRPIEE